MPWVEFIFPDAPAGAGCAWVGVQLPVQPAAADAAAGLDAAVANVHAMLTDLEASRGIDASRVVLGGCGPGAALALLAGRTFPKPLAGIACIGGWLLRPADATAAAASSARPPVLLCHAEEDDEVPIQLHYAACSWLRERGHEVTSHEYADVGGPEAAEAMTVLAAPKNFITFALRPLPRDGAAAAAAAVLSKAEELGSAAQCSWCSSSQACVRWPKSS